MASTIISSPTTYLLSSHKKPSLFSISSSLLLHPPKSTNYHNHHSSIPQLGLGLLSPWNGLKQLNLPFKQKSFKIVRKERSKKGKGVYASLFGVGAPEALVIGVVALLVFGPKGLAEVARNLGKTLRAFQPTIRELQDVSREFKSTLEREIGLDDIPPSAQSTSRSTTPTTSPSPAADIAETPPSPDQNGSPLSKKPYTTEEYLKTTEEQLKAMGAQQQDTPQEESENQSQIQEVEPPAKPFNIGEVLVQAQMRSAAAAQQEKITTLQETQSEPESQPQEEVDPSTSSPEGPENTRSEISSTEPTEVKN